MSDFQFSDSKAISRTIRSLARSSPSHCVHCAYGGWRLGNNTYLRDHVFFRPLKGGKLDLSTFTSQLAALPEMALPSILTDVPKEWNNGSVARIASHLSAIAAQSALFAEEIKRSLV